MFKTLSIEVPDLEATWYGEGSRFVLKRGNKILGYLGVVLHCRRCIVEQGGVKPKDRRERTTL